MYFLRWVGCLSVLAICYAQLIQVTDENFNELMKGGDEWLLEFYAPWCHHCQLFENSYRALDHQLKSGHKQVRLGQVDTEANPFLAARFFISRLPTLAHIKDKQVRWIQERRSGALLHLLEKDEWRAIEPVSGLLSPFGFAGVIFGYIAIVVKKISNMPPWFMVGSVVVMLIIAVGTHTLYGSDESGEEKKEVAPSEKKEATTTAISSKRDTSRKRISKRID